MLAFEMAQDVLQPVLDPPEIAGAGDRWRLRAAPADTTRAVRDGQTPMRCRCRPACGRAGRTARAARLRSVRNYRCTTGRSRLSSVEVSAAMRCSSTAKESLLLAGTGELIDLGRQHVHVVGKPRQRVVGGDIGDDGAQAQRSRLRAAERSTDRRWRAGSGRAWRRDCGSPRHSRRVARPASASAALRGFRRARVRCRRAPGRRCRSGGFRRCGATASGFRSRSIRSRGAASPR